MDENGMLNSRAPKVPFDARKILKTYKDYYFGSIELKKMLLSQRIQTANGFYRASAIIDA
jgi:hypothetical protein